MHDVAPQAWTEVLSGHWPLQRWLALAHDVARHVVPEQVVPPALVGQGAQTPPHSLYPLLHDSPHDVPSQVGTPFATVGQTRHDDPQAVTLVLSWQEPLQTR
jgi:hypothetical protein